MKALEKCKRKNASSKKGKRWVTSSRQAHSFKPMTPFMCECGCRYSLCEGCDCESHALLDHIPLSKLKETLESMQIDAPFTRNHVYHTIVTSTKFKSFLRKLNASAKPLDKKQAVAEAVKAALASPPSPDKVKRAIAKVQRARPADKKNKKRCAVT